MTSSSGQNDASPFAVATRATDLAFRFGEIMAASGVVVAARLGLMGAAMLNPLEGDYRELGRMVPEKVAALSHSGAALFDGLNAAQRDLAAQASDMARLLMGGVPSVASLSLLADAANARGSRAMLWPVTMGAATMRPVHRTVTANAKRLAA